MKEDGAEPSRQNTQGLPATPANSARMRAAMGGTGGMNISTGGPHILIFERDQKLAALLTSELQLAGYECHSARTAVEVFDAIARFPVRLVLVNLAQAAAGRREFWVALDAQRRGRGVQVFTFRCINLAGYGDFEPEEGSQTVLADMEVDGMLGINRLVEAVRTRIPGAGATTGPSHQNNPYQPNAGQGQPVYQAPSGNTGGFAPVSPQQSYNTSPRQPAVSPFTPTNQSPAPNGQASTAYPEKIRAVIYPGTRSFAQPIEGSNWSTAVPVSQQPAPTNYAQNQNDESSLAQLTRMLQEQRPGDAMQFLQQMAHGSNTGPSTSMSPGYRSPDNMSISDSNMRQSPIQEIPIEREVELRHERADGIPRLPYQPPQAPYINSTQAYATAPVPAAHPPQENGNGFQGQQIISEMDQFSPSYPTVQVASVQPQRQNQRQVSPRTNPNEQFSQTTPPVQVQYSQPMPAVQPQQPPTPQYSQPMPAVQPTPPPYKQPYSQHGLAINRGNSAQQVTEKNAQPTTQSSSTEPRIVERTSANNEGQDQQKIVPPPPTPTRTAKAEENSAKAEETIVNSRQRDLLEQIQTIVQNKRPSTEAESAQNETMLLDIVQSLPPMPEISQQASLQAQVLNGRATRSLGSVLLEGHLVPQNRLEVAHGIQRMLKGVDMNYQLGEILLMFKLLTPDQLLAASLVSFGLITTQQISSLGKIRQELHTIGLEYDLEALVILFRILTPEQLREVRNGW